MVFSKNWISKNWKSIDNTINEYQWISINEYQWISINEFIDGPSMNMVPFLWALSLGSIGPPLDPVILSAIVWIVVVVDWDVCWRRCGIIGVQ